MRELMRKMRRADLPRRLTTLLAGLLVACATAWVRDVQIAEGKDVVVPPSCMHGGTLRASDGHLSRFWMMATMGTKEAAIERMKRNASERGWNFVVLDPARATEARPSVEEIGHGKQGAEITIFGEVYFCPAAPR